MSIDPSESPSSPLPIADLWGAGFWASGLFLYPRLSIPVCLTAPTPNIGFGSLSSWSLWASPWAPSTSRTAPSPTVGSLGGEGGGYQEGVGSPEGGALGRAALCSGPQTPGYWLSPCSHLGDSTLVLGCIPIWHLGRGQGEGASPSTHSLPQSLCAC